MSARLSVAARSHPVSCAPQHPGSVVVIEPDGEEQVVPADRLPAWATFVSGPGGRRLPVGYLARVRGPNGLVIRSYGTDGRLLAVTTAPTGWPPSPPEPTSGGF